MKYLKNCDCIEDLKKKYREMSLKYHPDINRDADAVEIMQAINHEYDILFDELKNVFRNKKGEIYIDKKPVSETPEEFRNIINELIILNGIEIELIGRWIWVSGNTRPHKDKLKELNFKWCPKKGAWCWHRKEDGVVSHGKKSLNEIREKYGVTKYTDNKSKEIEEKAS